MNYGKQCKICYKFCTVPESPSSESLEQLSEHRQKLLTLCSEYLFNELCDWQHINSKETLPFCAECSGVIQRIFNLDGKFKTRKLDISVFSEKFTVKVLRLRNRRNHAESISIGGVPIKTEKGIEQCKICHGMYDGDSVHEFTMSVVKEIIHICKTYLFSEIFDEGCLDVDRMVNRPPFCVDCYESIQHIRRRNDHRQRISREIETLVNNFTLQVLNSRKRLKSVYSILCAGDTVDNKKMAPCEEIQESDDDSDDCMIIDVIPGRVSDPPSYKMPDDEMKWNQTHKIEQSPEEMSSVETDDEYLHENNPQPPPSPKLTKKVEDSAPTMNSFENAIKRDFLSLNIEEDEEQCNFLEALPEKPSTDTKILANNRFKPGIYKCQNCPAVFDYEYKRLRHLDYCFEDDSSKNSNSPPENEIPSLFECKICDNYFLSENELDNHQKIHNPPYKCIHCKRFFIRKCHLDKHLNSKSCQAENVNEIPPTTQTFPPRMTLRHNTRKTSVQNSSKAGSKNEDRKTKKYRTFRCSICPQIFNHQFVFSKHLQSHYNDPASNHLQCNWCRQVFNTIANKNRHIATFHRNIDFDFQIRLDPDYSPTGK